MSIVSRTILKNYFLTGAKPTQSQFADFIDSLFHLTENEILLKLAYDPARTYTLGMGSVFSNELYTANKTTTGAFTPADWDIVTTPLTPGAVAATDVSVTNAGYSTVQEVLDDLLYILPQITSITNTVNEFEIGQTIDDVTLNWTRNKDVDIQSYDQGIGVISNTVVQLILATQGITATTTYTLTITDSKPNSDIQGTTIFGRRKRHWGTSPNASLTTAQILALANDELSDDLDQSRIMSGGGDYLYFSWPVSYGQAVFTVGGLQSTFVEAIVSHTNASGDTVDYYTYRSLNTTSGVNEIVEAIPI